MPLSQERLVIPQPHSGCGNSLHKGRVRIATSSKHKLQMEFFARKNGSDGIAFDFIVVSGKNSSLPHGVPTDKKLENGESIFKELKPLFK